MTEHPQDLLAEYAEGTLPPDGRAGVEDHLKSCPTCREDVELARAGRRALAGLPRLEAPEGLGMAVGRGVRRPPRATRWVAAAAAAALFLAGGTAVIIGFRESAPTRMEQEPASSPEEEGQAQDERTAGSQEALAGGDAKSTFRPTYRETNRDHDPDSLAAEGRRLRDRARTELGSIVPLTSAEFYRSFDPDAFPPPTREAIRCILQELPPDDIAAPFSIELARFEGTPAYVATFLQGPTASSRHDRLLIWVLDRETCRLRYFATARL